MSRTNRFLSGIGFGYASQVLTTLVALWLTPFLLHRIGQHDYGLWLVGTQLMFYLALLDLGVVALLPRETAFATGRAETIEEATDLPLLIGQTVRLIVWQMPLVALAAAIAWFMMPADWEGLRNPIGVVLLAFVLTFPLRIFGAVLHGLQDHAFLGRTSIISYLLSTAITVALVFAGWGLYALAVGWMALQFFIAIASWYRLRTHFPSVLPRSLPEMLWPTARTRLTQGFWVSLAQVAQVLLNGTDILIIGKLFGPAAVVPFVCTGKMISVLSNQPQMLMAAAGPALSQMRMGESRERLPEVCTALGQAMLMLSGAVVCVVLAVNQGFVGRWVGANQYGGFWLTALILLSMLLRHWNLTIGYTLLCFGHERRLCLTALLDGLVSVGGVALFVWLYGLIGAPLGMILGACLISLPANLSALARENKMTIWEMMRPLVPWFARFVVLVGGTGALARIWTPDTFLLLGLTAIVVLIIYAAVMFPLALRAPLGVYVRPRLFPLRTRVFRALRLGSSA
ncbi:MAG TPA: oligosaccharide flippase family protein [Pyrinomonadaceae bacterium]